MASPHPRRRTPASCAARRRRTSPLRDVWRKLHRTSSRSAEIWSWLWPAPEICPSSQGEIPNRRARYAETSALAQKLSDADPTDLRLIKNVSLDVVADHFAAARWNQGGGSRSHGDRLSARPRHAGSRRSAGFRQRHAAPHGGWRSCAPKPRMGRSHESRRSGPSQFTPGR